MEQIETTIAGIPCVVKVVDFVRVHGSYSYDAPSDLDYSGYVSMDYEVCDRRGRPAPWLERKLTPKERARIEEEITGHFCAHE